MHGNRTAIVIIAIVLMAAGYVLSSEPVDSADAIELHDDLSNDEVYKKSDAEGYLNSLSEDQRKEFLEMQKVRNVGCILYSQIYFNTHEQDIQTLFGFFNDKLHIGLFEKLVGRLIIHCMKNIKDEDVIKVRSKVYCRYSKGLRIESSE